MWHNLLTEGGPNWRPYQPTPFFGTGSANAWQGGMFGGQRSPFIMLGGSGPTPYGNIGSGKFAGAMIGPLPRGGVWRRNLGTGPFYTGPIPEVPVPGTSLVGPLKRPTIWRRGLSAGPFYTGPTQSFAPSRPSYIPGTALVRYQSNLGTGALPRTNMFLRGARAVPGPARLPLLAGAALAGSTALPSVTAGDAINFLDIGIPGYESKKWKGFKESHPKIADTAELALGAGSLFIPGTLFAKLGLKGAKAAQAANAAKGAAWTNRSRKGKAAVGAGAALGGASLYNMGLGEDEAGNVPLTGALGGIFSGANDLVSMMLSPQASIDTRTKSSSYGKTMEDFLKSQLVKDYVGQQIAGMQRPYARAIKDRKADLREELGALSSLQTEHNAQSKALNAQVAANQREYDKYIKKTKADQASEVDAAMQNIANMFNISETSRGEMAKATTEREAGLARREQADREYAAAGGEASSDLINEMAAVSQMQHDLDVKRAQKGAASDISGLRGSLLDIAGQRAAMEMQAAKDLSASDLERAALNAGMDRASMEAYLKQYQDQAAIDEERRKMIALLMTPMSEISGQIEGGEGEMTTKLPLMSSLTLDQLEAMVPGYGQLLFDYNIQKAQEADRLIHGE